MKTFSILLIVSLIFGIISAIASKLLNTTTTQSIVFTFIGAVMMLAIELVEKINNKNNNK